MMYLQRFIFSVLVFGCCLSAYSNQDPRSSAQFYIDHFGQIDKQEQPLADRAQAIFSKLLRIADNAKAKVPALILIDSDSWPWAIALPDNSVILTRGALELCYRNVSEKQGDVRLAMLLGHELAHLDEDDYWHRDVYLALANNESSADEQILQFIGERSGLVKSAEWKNIVRDRELKADDRGAIYASLAGYDLTNLLTDDKGNFFQYWAKNTVNEESDYYLTAQQRGDYLKSKLTSLINLPQAYKAGLGLISMGYFEQAEVLYKSISRRFPAHEVYNNLGYLKLAQIESSETDNKAIKFWLPLSLDINPGTPILLRGNESGLVVHENLAQSIEYFELAVQRSPAYLTGILNLTSAYFLAGRYDKASAVIEDAQKQGISSPQLELMDVLVLYVSLRGKVSIEQYVIERLDRLIKQSPSLLMVNFNLAQIFELENQTELAQSYWQSLAQAIEVIPNEYRKIIARKSNVELPYLKKVKLEPLLLMLEDLTEGQKMNSDPIIENYDSIQLSILPALTKTYYRQQRLINSIALPSEVLLQVLNQCCNQPEYKQISMLGELWVYPDGLTALFMTDNENSELIISQSLQDQLVQFHQSLQ